MSMKTKELVCPHCDRKGGLKRFEGLGHKKYGYDELRCKHCGVNIPPLKRGALCD